jgi:hypothetical protein
MYQLVAIVLRNGSLQRLVFPQTCIWLDQGWRLEKLINFRLYIPLVRAESECVLRESYIFPALQFVCMYDVCAYLAIYS